MTLLCYDDLFLKHDTGNHPESIERLQVAWNHLKASGLVEKCETATWDPASTEQVARVHSENHIEFVRKSADKGGGSIEADTVMSSASYDVAMKASGAICHAVEQVVQGKHPNALSLVRPPGHHARPGNAMGFCLFNHIAVAARHATDALGVDRVLVIDWDVHHGNGTQEMFYETENIGYLSIHRSPFYPGTGKVSETGKGAGLGSNLNIPLEFGVQRKQFLDKFRRGLEDIAGKLRPNLILISAGFDAHRNDPIGSLSLEVEDFATLTEIVLQCANEQCGGKVASMLEGGYNPKMLAESLAAHLVELQKAPEIRPDAGTR